MSAAETLGNPIMRLYIEELIECDDEHEIKEIQRALVNLGKDIMVDGEFGPITARAIKSVNNKRLAQEILDRRIHPPADAPPWIAIALKELGTKEIPGKGGSNPRIEQYHDAVGLPWAKDDVPWCGAFVGFCMLKAGYDIPKTAARALSWMGWGFSADEPVFGAIAIKKRKGGGHVTFVVGREGDTLYCLGGNQHDAVNIARYPVGAFKDFRIPKGYRPKVKLSKWEGVSALAGKES